MGQSFCFGSDDGRMDLMADVAPTRQPSAAYRCLQLASGRHLHCHGGYGVLNVISFLSNAGTDPLPFRNLTFRR